MSIRRFAAAATLVLTIAASVLAKEPTGQSLFNGKDLDGWTVTGCEAGVEDGAIVLKSGDGYVQSKDRYRDFVLEVEWKARKPSQYDSGIYIRAQPPTTGGRAWPDKYQVNLQEGAEGNLIRASSGGKSTGLVKKGDWNHFRLTVQGTTAKLQINGQDAWTAEGLENPEGHIGLQSEVPKGGQFEFRNIRVTELK